MKLFLTIFGAALAAGLVVLGVGRATAPKAAAVVAPVVAPAEAPRAESPKAEAEALPEKPKAEIAVETLRETARIMAPGGVLMVARRELSAPSIGKAEAAVRVRFDAGYKGRVADVIDLAGAEAAEVAAGLGTLLAMELPGAAEEESRAFLRFGEGRLAFGIEGSGKGKGTVSMHAGGLAIALSRADAAELARALEAGAAGVVKK